MKEIEDERKTSWWAKCIIVVVRFYLQFDIKSKHGCTHTLAHPPPSLFIIVSLSACKKPVLKQQQRTKISLLRTPQHDGQWSIRPATRYGQRTPFQQQQPPPVNSDYDASSATHIPLRVCHPNCRFIAYPSLFTPLSIQYLLLVKNRNTFPSLISRFWSTHTMAYLYR